MSRRVSVQPAPRSGVASEVRNVPAEPHFYVIADENVELYDGCDSSRTEARLYYRWFLDESEWKSFISSQSIRPGSKTFVAGKSVPAAIRVDISIDF